MGLSLFVHYKVRADIVYVFSEREFMFMFVYNVVVTGPSVCLSSVTFVRHTQTIEIFSNVSVPSNMLVT